MAEQTGKLSCYCWVSHPQTPCDLYYWRYFEIKISQSIYWDIKSWKKIVHYKSLDRNQTHVCNAGEMLWQLSYSGSWQKQAWLLCILGGHTLPLRIDLMHKSSYGPWILGNRNLRIVIGYSSRRVTNNNA